MQAQRGVPANAFIWALVAAGLVVALLAARALIVVFAGILLAVLLRALGDGLARHARLPRLAALWIAALIFFGVIGVGVWLLASEVAKQFEELGAALATYWSQVEGWLGRYAWGRELLSVLSDGTGPESKVDLLGRIVGNTLAALSTLLIAVVIALYLAASPQRYRNGLLELIPLAQRERVARMLRALEQALRSWLVGTLINMTAVGVVTTIGLWLLDIPFALALGVLAFALEFVPYLGPILSAIPAVLVAMTVGPAQAGYTALLYLAVQQFEEYLLVPYVYHRSVNVAPALTIAAQLVMGVLLGVLGIVFATPLAACATVLTDELRRVARRAEA